ncbi:GntR family transcriptional regulator [Desulforhopalus sp. 52FAK]
MVNRSLVRDQVYDYIRVQMSKGILQPGSIVSKKKLIEELGVSQTPLREAFLQLQADGFVTILPQRGVEINALAWTDVKYIYEILGSLEYSTILSVFDSIGKAQLKKMHSINKKMYTSYHNKDNHKYYMENINFHNVYLDLSNNKRMVDIIKKQRQVLFDFPRKKYGTGWREENYNEHLEFLEILEKGNALEAGSFIKDVHLRIKEKYLTIDER